MKTLERFSCTNRDLGLVDAEPEQAFDGLSALAARLFDVPVALVSIVEEENDRQFFKSQVGLAEPWAATRQTPLSDSFCRHVKERDEPLVVNNSAEHELVRDNGAVTKLDVIAYLGVPIYSPNRRPIGALCVIDHKSRDWSAEDVGLLKALAGCVSNEILLRASLRKGERLRQALESEYERVNRYTAVRESISVAFITPDLTMEDRFVALLRSTCDALDATVGLIARQSLDELLTLFHYNRSDDLQASSRTKIDGSLSDGPLKNGRIIIHRDLSKEFPSVESYRTTPRSYVGVPLIFDGKTFGVVEFYFDHVLDECWGEEEFSIINLVSLFVSSNIQLYSEIDDLRRSESALRKQLIDAELRNVSFQQPNDPRAIAS